MTPPKLPPFESLLKSRDVEDPVNLLVHRPLAYGLVALIYRSPITPNQITLLATLVGIAAGACFYVGGHSLMIWGGALLWASAILDGADGILARAQNSFSALGRALDGSADAVVAVFTVFPAFYHLWVVGLPPQLLWFAPVAVGSAVLHIELYDFYKESYLTMTNPRWSGKPERVADTKARLDQAIASRAPLLEIIVNHMYVGLITGQTNVVALTNRFGMREQYDYKVDARTVEIYRRNNRAPMKLWAAISLAPHSYTMAICAMFDHLEIYFAIRLVLCNLLFVIALLWQRSKSRRTLEELKAIGMAPTLAEAASASA